MLRPVELSATGVITCAGEVGPGSVQVKPEGIMVKLASGETVEKQAWEIVRVDRESYKITVEFARDAPIIFAQFARRTDELERALWRCRCDAIAQLMAPGEERPLEVIEATGQMAGWLYRYRDGLRWVPQEGPCFTRLYGELEGCQFDRQAYALNVWGPFGQSRLLGLARRTSELEQEARGSIAEAKDVLITTLRSRGLAWRGDVWGGGIRQHVPFRATQARLAAVEYAEGLIVEERREYWDSLREDRLISRLVISSNEQGYLRLIALCPVASGELYEVLSEEDHASFVFKSADPVVRAWTEVGFRREPVFEAEAEEAGPYEALAQVLPSLAAARASLVRRVVHDSVDQWRSALA